MDPPPLASTRLDPSSREHRARQKIEQSYSARKIGGVNVHTVSFQPQGVSQSEDRVLTQMWEIGGDHWICFGVFDGHMGQATVGYTIQRLPTLIRRKLRAFVQNIGGHLDRSNIAENESKVADMLKREVEQFDQGLGTPLRRSAHARGSCPLDVSYRSTSP